MMNLAKRVKTEKKLAAAILKTFQEAEALMDLMIKEPRRYKSEKS